MNMQLLLLAVRTLSSLQSVMIAECAGFVVWVKQRLSIRLGNGLERLPCTFSMMGPSTEMLAKGVAMDLGMRSASQGCFSNSADVGRSLGFLYEQPSVSHAPHDRKCDRLS